MIADAGDALPNGDLRQSGTAVKRRVANRGQAIRDADRSQRWAVVERARSDLGNTVFQNDPQIVRLRPISAPGCVVIGVIRIGQHAPRRIPRADSQGHFLYGRAFIEGKVVDIRVAGHRDALQPVASIKCVKAYVFYAVRQGDFDKVCPFLKSAVCDHPRAGFDGDLDVEAVLAAQKHIVQIHRTVILTVPEAGAEQYIVTDPGHRLGNIETDQAAAAVECTVTNACHAVRQGDRRQSLAAVKGFGTDGSGPVRNDHRLDLRTIPERAAGNLCDPLLNDHGDAGGASILEGGGAGGQGAVRVSEGHRLEPRAVVEGAAVQGQGGGHGQGGEAGAAVEGVAAHGFEAVGQGQRLQAHAVCKGVGADDEQLLRDVHAAEGGAVGEGIGADILHPVRDDDAAQGGAAGEGVFADAGEAIGQVHRLELVAVGIPGRWLGGAVIPHLPAAGYGQDPGIPMEGPI